MTSLDFEGARLRAQRRKSRWNLLLIPFCLASIVFIWGLQFKVAWLINLASYPDHRAQDFWQNRVHLSSALFSVVMLIAPFAGAVGTGMMLGNLLIHLIAPARRVLDAEAVGYPGTDYASTQRALWRLSRWPLVIGFAASMIAARFLESFR